MVSLQGYLLARPGTNQSSIPFLSYFTREHGKIRLFVSPQKKKYSHLTVLRQPFLFFTIHAKETNTHYYPQSASIDHSFAAITHQWDVYRLGWFLLGFQEEILVQDDFSPSIYWAFHALCRNLVHNSPMSIKTQLVIRFCTFLVSETGFDRGTILENFCTLPEFTIHEQEILKTIICCKTCRNNITDTEAWNLLLKTRIAWEYLFDYPLKSFDFL